MDKTYVDSNISFFSNSSINFSNFISNNINNFNNFNVINNNNVNLIVVNKVTANKVRIEIKSAKRSDNYYINWNKGDEIDYKIVKDLLLLII